MALYRVVQPSILPSMMIHRWFYYSAMILNPAWEIGATSLQTTTTDWTLDSGGTPSSATGPAAGANASTYYVYLETSSGYAYTAGGSAILSGPSTTSANIHLTFQYHMFGTLAVDVLSGGIWINDVWSITGQQQVNNSEAYTAVDVNLSAYTVSQVRFRATAAGGYTGDMAVDNVEIISINPAFNDSDAVGYSARFDKSQASRSG